MTTKKTAPAPSKREENAAKKREAIVAAALAEFMEHGFEAARMDAIAQRANVGKGTLYLYFADKESLFEGAILAVVAPFKDRMAALAERDVTASAATIETIAQFMPELLSDPNRTTVVSLLIREGMRFPHLVQFYYRKVIKPTMALLQKIMSDAGKRGVLRDERMARYPQMLLMPAIFWLMWQNIFGSQESLDLQEIMDIHLSNSLLRENPAE